MKYAYSTTGTSHFLLSLANKIPEETVTFMKNVNNTLVYYETNSKRSVFSAGNKYDIYASYGTIPHKAFVVIQHVPIPKDTAKLFQTKVNNTFDKFTLAYGLECARILKVRRKSEYHIYMFWESETDFDRWKKDDSEHEDFSTFVRKPAYFAERAYTSYYSILDKEQLNK